MLKLEKIKKICEGKVLRIFAARQERNTVSFVESFRNCGNCSRCRKKSNRPHGPYWNMNYTDDGGRARSLYIGKELPDLDGAFENVSFADVIEFYKKEEASKQSISRYQQEIKAMKMQMERLFEELRSARRSHQKRPAIRAEKFFRQLAIKYHPDRNSKRSFLADDVMKDINQLFQLVRE